MMMFSLPVSSRREEPDFSDDSFIDELLENIDMIDTTTISIKTPEYSLENSSSPQLETSFPSTSSSSLTFSSSSSSSSSSSTTSLSQKKKDTQAFYIKNRHSGKQRRVELKSGIKEVKHHGPGRPRKYIPIAYVPRVVKHDIRRKYAEMYTNVMNSYDFDLMRAYFQKFYVPNSSMKKLPPQSIIPWMEVKGRDVLLYYYLLLSQSTPDKVSRVSNIQIIQRSDSLESEISFTTEISYTQIYDIPMGAIQKSLEATAYLFRDPKVTISQKDELELQRKLPEELEFLLPGLDTGLFDPIRGSFIPSRFPRLLEPKYFCGTGTTILKLNEHKQIQAIVYSPFTAAVTSTADKLC